VPIRRTLGDLRDEVLRRLGFLDQGPPAQANRLLVEDFVRAAQRELWMMLDFPELKRIAEITVRNQTGIRGRPEIYWDWPPDCDPRRIYAVEAMVNGWWQPLAKGIGPSEDSLTASGYRAFPQRWDIGPQLEIWPAPDQDYIVRITYQAKPARFSQPSDPASIDEDLILLHATTQAKLHYRQEDAQVYAQQLAALIGRLRAASHVDGIERQGEVIPMPVRVV